MITVTNPVAPPHHLFTLPPDAYYHFIDSEGLYKDGIIEQKIAGENSCPSHFSLVFIEFKVFFYTLRTASILIDYMRFRIHRAIAKNTSFVKLFSLPFYQTKTFP